MNSWKETYKNILRPWVNEAPTVEELESYLENLADMAYKNVGELETPEDAADSTIISFLTLAKK